MVKVIIRQLIMESLGRSNWLEFEFEMEFPPVPGMNIKIKCGDSVEIETVSYEIGTRNYVCYPSEYRVRHGDSCTFEEIVKQYLDMGFHHETKSR